MNEDLKRLIEALNNAGYEVTAFEDRDGDIEDGSYRASGLFRLTVFKTTEARSKR